MKTKFLKKEPVRELRADGKPKKLRRDYPDKIYRRSKGGLTAKQEAFAQHYAVHGSPREAFIVSYNPGPSWKRESVNRKGVELARHPKVMVRIEELKANAAKRNEVTVDSLIAELTAAVEIAKESKQAAAIVQATLAKARLLGMLVDKVETKATQFVVHAPEPEPDTASWVASVNRAHDNVEDDEDLTLN
jgi:phage terminase small subunit